MAKIESTRVKGRAGAPTLAAARSAKASIFESVSRPAAGQHLKGVLFGPPKTKKTLTSCSGSGQKLLVLTEPEGDLPLAGRTDVDVVRPTNWAEMNEVVAGLHTGAYGQWDRVIFDSVTFMFEVIGSKELANTMRENKDARRTYLRAGTAVNQLIHDAVALPMDVIFTVQMKIDSPDEEQGDQPLDPELGEYNWTLAVTPMVYKILAPAVSFLGRTYKKVGYEGGNKVVEYWVSFEDYGRSPAGARLLVPDQVRDLDMDMLLAALKKEA